MRLLPYTVLFCAAAACISYSAAQSHDPPPPKMFRLARAFGSSMVLQAENPTLAGFGPPGSVVTAATSDGETANATVDLHSGRWLLRLQPRAASRPADSDSVTISLSCEGQSEGVNVSDVLFGDVWICSGQSNMEFSVSEAFDAENIIATSAIEGLRLFSVQKNVSATSPAELPDLIDVQTPGGGWVRSSPANVCGDEYNNDRDAYCGPHCGPSASNQSFARPTWGYFSAACFLHGREVLRKTGRPQGLLETSWGGTTIESWSSSAALQQCDGSGAAGVAGVTGSSSSSSSGSSSPRRAEDGPDNGPRWAAMVAPLLSVGIRGALWYQGEANAGNIDKANKYACQIKALIQDWRSRWAAEGNLLSPAAAAEGGGGGGGSEGGGGDFPFIIAALAPKAGNASPVLRFSQFGAVKSLKAVGIANLVDLYDAGSPCGQVHIRNKTVVGERLAEASLALAYNISSAEWNGPVPTSMHLAGATEAPVTIEIAFENAQGQRLESSDLAFVNLTWNAQTTEPASQNYEVLLSTGGNAGFAGSAQWVQAAASIGSSGVVVHAPTTTTTEADVIGLRYAFADTPLGQQLFSLRRGGDPHLPAMPFVANCSAKALSCTLLQPGEVPALYAQAGAERGMY